MSQEANPKTSNFFLFIFLSFGVLMLYQTLFAPKKPPLPQPDKKVAAANAEPGKAKPNAEKTQAKENEEDEPATVEEDAEEDAEEAPDQAPGKLEREPKIADPRWFTLGSADPADPYRMLVTVTDQGAAVSRIELNSPRYRALMDDGGYLAESGGYLGRIVMDEQREGKGCLVQVVGQGTPAEKAGLRPGDIITAIGQKPITGAKSLKEKLSKTKPGRTIELTVLRDGKQLAEPIRVKLGVPPMEVIRPDGNDPASFLMTLSRIDKKRLADMDVDEKQKKDEIPVYVNKELKGLNLRGGNWDVVEHTQDKIVFRCTLPRWGLEVTKIYRLTPVPADKQDDSDYPAYSLTLDVQIRNVGKKDHKVAYQLDGPTGLPIEGWWYANKVGYCWNAGIRDVIVCRNNDDKPTMVSCTTLSDDKHNEIWSDSSITYIGVDAQYFSALMIPQKEDPNDIWFAESVPMRVGPVNEDIKRITDVSCRMWSVTADLSPEGKPLAHSFTIFAGPKRTDILAQPEYKLEALVYYGWFDFFAKPMVSILHFFYAIVCNYGLAILMLTVVVRGLMFPLSRKQALGAQKMALLQPEIKKLQEKHKKDMEARTKAQQELFKKHNYNPLSGCLVMFVQLPIFLGLYRGLMVDVELRGSPLLGAGIRWCSNLSAPDMLYCWNSWMSEWLTYGIGAFKLGPYFNLLPIVTVVLFLLQQKMFMPPPADEQQAMQQNIMKYMMLFMGILFFKVASGLCIYFIASSAWGLAERKLLPKAPKKDGDAEPPERPDRKKSKGGNDRSDRQSRRNKTRRK